MSTFTFTLSALDIYIYFSNVYFNDFFPSSLSGPHALWDGDGEDEADASEGVGG